jgi:predicted MFS family arabinose efflux permease
VSQAAVADVVPPRERGRYQGYFSSVMAISNVLGPVLGGLFAQDLSWHWIFWINIPFGVLAIVLCNRNLKRLPRPHRRVRIDWLGAALIVAAATPLLLGLSGVEAGGSWLLPQVWVPMVIGVVLIAILLAWEREARSPMIPLRLFGNRIFAVASLITFTMSMVMIALIILVPLAFELLGRLSPDDAGMRLIPMTGGTVVGSYIAGQLVTRSGRYRIYPVIGAAGMTLSCIGIAVLGLGHSLLPDTALTALLGLSFGFQLAPVIVPVQNALALEDTGIGLAAVMFFRLIGGAFGVALLSAVLMAQLNAAALATPGHEVLGPDPGVALFHLELAGQAPAGLLAHLGGALQTAFSRVFFAAAAISAVTFVGGLFLKEIPLRGAAPAANPQPSPVRAASRG